MLVDHLPETRFFTIEQVSIALAQRLWLTGSVFWDTRQVLRVVYYPVAAMNPCPCGYHGDAGGRCRCTPDQVQRYRARLSGPLLDRLDLQLEVPALPAEALQRAADGESSATVRARVTEARERQLARQGKPNARLSTKEIDRHCEPDAAGAALLKQAAARLALSARAYHRTLKVARTIADLAASPAIQSPHIAEAVQYRRFAKD